MLQAGFPKVFTLSRVSANGFTARLLSVLVRLGLWPPNPRVCVVFRVFFTRSRVAESLAGQGFQRAGVARLFFSPLRSEKKRRAVELDGWSSEYALRRSCSVALNGQLRWPCKARDVGCQRQRHRGTFYADGLFHRPCIGYAKALPGSQPRTATTIKSARRARGLESASAEFSRGVNPSSTVDRSRSRRTPKPVAR